MKISTNTFSKKSLGSGSTLSRKTVSESSNSFAKKSVRKGENAWGGDNTSADVYGYDNLESGDPFGTQEFGKITHFKNRSTPPSISH